MKLEDWDDLFFGSTIIPLPVKVEESLRGYIVKTNSDGHAMWFVGEMDEYGKIVAIKRLDTY